jgi:hypothetical protein
MRPKFAKLNNTKFPPLRPRLAALRAYFEGQPEPKEKTDRIPH